MVGKTVRYIKDDKAMEGVVLDKYSGVTEEYTYIGVGNSGKQRVSNPIGTDFYIVQPTGEYSDGTGAVNHIKCKSVIRIVQR